MNEVMLVATANLGLFPRMVNKIGKHRYQSQSHALQFWSIIWRSELGNDMPSRHLAWADKPAHRYIHDSPRVRPSAYHASASWRSELGWDMPRRSPSNQLEHL